MATDAPLMPGYAPLEHLSDEDLDYLLTQHGETQSAMQTLSDEDLQALLRDYEAPEGNIDPENVPVVGLHRPRLPQAKSWRAARASWRAGRCSSLATRRRPRPARRSRTSHTRIW